MFHAHGAHIIQLVAILRCAMGAFVATLLLLYASRAWGEEQGAGLGTGHNLPKKSTPSVANLAEENAGPTVIPTAVGQSKEAAWNVKPSTKTNIDQGESQGLSASQINPSIAQLASTGVDKFSSMKTQEKYQEIEEEGFRPLVTLTSSSNQPPTGRNFVAGASTSNSGMESREGERILAVVSAYSDDISWLLAEDHGGENWRWRLPTELYQVCDIDKDCQPTFPGLPHNSQEDVVYPLPGWPEWAEEWVAKACTAQREGIVPGSSQHSLHLAAQQAGVPIPPGMRRRRSLLESDSQEEKQGGRARGPVINFPSLTPLPLHLVPNRASEGTGYLAAIIRHYDNLPDVMLFMHGHAKSWHAFAWGQDFLLDRLAVIAPRNLSSGYMQLGCFELDEGHKGNQVFPTIIDANHKTYGSLGPRWHESFAAHYMQAWIEHLGKAFGQARPPPFIKAACCASFAVSKEAVLRRPKSFYEGLLQWMMRTPMERYWLGVIMEFSWHMMFTGQAVYDPPKQQCLCELYDICTTPL